MSSTLKAQFEGKVIYRVKYSSEDPTKGSMLEMLPEYSTLLLKGEMLRFNQEIIGGGRQSFVIDAGNNSNTLLMSFMGQEFRVPMNEDEVSQLQAADELKLVKTEKTMVIQGYECTHAMAITSEDTLNVYFTDRIQVPPILPQFSQIDGLPLMYEVKKGDIRMTYTCSSIAEGQIDDQEFEIPSHIKAIPFKYFARNFAIMK